MKTIVLLIVTNVLGWFFCEKNDFLDRYVSRISLLIKNYFLYKYFQTFALSKVAGCYPAKFQDWKGLDLPQLWITLPLPLEVCNLNYSWMGLLHYYFMEL